MASCLDLEHTGRSIQQEEEAMEKKSTPFGEMTPAHKVRFLAKLVICILTFGFVFPNVMGD
jgi:hypothetical protein